jgi:dCTP diphosphatase
MIFHYWGVEMTIEELQRLTADFRDARDWGKHHTVQNLIMAIASEAGEMCHEARWGNPDMAKIRREMADVAIFLLSLADIAGINLGSAIIEKIRANELKYPFKGK